MSFHHNFGVSETTDEFDGLLHHTVANLKNPPHVPASHAPHNFVTPTKAKLMTKGYPISSTEGFVGTE